MLKIVKDTNPSLRKKCQDVELPLSKENEKLIFEMMEYLLNSQDEEYRSKHPECREGVGLAAPQIGANLKMLVISYPNPTEEDENAVTSHMLVNPRITEASIKQCALRGGEGCLSVDEEHNGKVYRHFKIVVEAYEAREKKKVHIVARGYDAIVLQHEIDHLSGILFYDHIDKKDPEKEIPGAILI